MGKKVTVLDHLKSVAQEARNFTNGLVSDLATATTEAIEEMEERISSIDGKVGGFTYSEVDETLTVPLANGTVANETLTLK